jgi:ankyrin repeat protein
MSEWIISSDERSRRRRHAEISVFLHDAVNNGDLEATMRLLGEGAPVDEFNLFGRIPRVVAIQRGFLEVTHCLVEHGVCKASENGTTPLYVAVEKGHLEVVQCLVQHGADKDKTDNDCWRPLHIAACKGHLEVVEYLLEQGADRDKQNKLGYTPLHLAAMMGHLEVAKALMRYGANLNARTKLGQLPIDLARSEDIKQAIIDEEKSREHT